MSIEALRECVDLIDLIFAQSEIHRTDGTMSLQRRDFLKTGAAAGAMAMLPRHTDAQSNGIPIALGEEEMGLRQFRYIIERDVSEKGMLKVPTGPGLGIQIDPAFLEQAQVVTA
jgi:hypothetical protein